MNAQKVRRATRAAASVELRRLASRRGSVSLRGLKIPSSSAHELPGYPGRPAKPLPPFRLSAADDPEPIEGDDWRRDLGRSRQSATGRILIVEDDADLRETLADILQYEGFHVETASNGQEAWLRLAAEPLPALVLLDLKMPVMDGWEFRARQLRDPQIASVPVVLISAAEEIRQQAALLSADAFLSKPIDVSRLIDVVSRFVR